MTNKYEKMTQQEFDEILLDILREYTGKELITIVPNIYSDLAEYFNNEVLAQWDAKQGKEE